MAQIMDGILTFSGWAGSAAMDATMLSMLAKMRAQLAGLFTVSAVDPYELFTDIVDGIGDIEDPADIAGQLEELEFTQTEVNQAIFRFIAHIKKAHNYKVSHNTQVYPLGLDDYENLIFTQSIGLGTPPRFDDNEEISTLMYGKTGINNNLYVAGDIFFNATFDGSDLLTAHDYFTNKTSLTTSLNGKQDNLILGNNLSFDTNKNLQVNLNGLQDALSFFHPINNTNNVITLLYNAAYFDLIDSKLSIKSSVLTAKQDILTHSHPFVNTNDTITLNYNESHFNLTNNKLNLVNTTFYNKAQFLTDYETHFKFDTNSFTKTTDADDITTYSVTGGGGGVWTKDVNDDISYTDGNVGIGTSANTNRLVIQCDNNDYVKIQVGINGTSQTGGVMIGIPAFGTAGCARIASTSIAGDKNNLSFWTSSGGSSTTERMRIDQAGNVGINCSPGDYKLDINGDTRINGNLTFANHTTQFYTASDGLNKLIIIPCTKSGYWSTLKVKISIVGENANGSADTRYEHEAEGSTYQNLTDLVITKLSTLQTYIKVVCKWDGLVEGTRDAPKVLIYIDPNGVPYLAVKVELFGSYNVKFENGSIATFEDTFPNNNDFAGSYEHYLAGNLDITGNYKINGNDLTTDNIAESATKKYSQWTTLENNDISYTEGNVGIGTLPDVNYILNVHTTGTKKGLIISNPTQPVMVFNDGNHGDRLTLGYRKDNTYDENNLSAQILVDTTGNINYYSRTNYLSSHIFYTNNGIQRMKINPTSGNVGIGGNGDFKLDVDGDINTTTGYKINCSDLTTDNIPQTSTNLYYNYSTTAGQLNTLLKHSGSGMASFLRFRSGGNPSGTAGVCLSSYDNNNFFIYGYDGDLIIRHTDAFTTTLDTRNQPNGTTSKADLIKLNTTSLNVNVPLNVNGDINTTGSYKINGSDISTDNIAEGTNKKYSQWTTSGNDISYSLGDIGLGTDFPSQKLEVRGIAAISDGIYFRGIITPNSFTPTTTRNWRISTGQSQEGTFQIGCRNDYNDTIPIFFTNPEFARMTIKHNGYVGVGLTNPTAKLHTEGGNIIFNSAGEASDLIIGLGTPHTNSCYKSAIVLDAANSYSRNNMHFCLRDTADNSTNAGIGDAKLSILRAGNVGLGTSNPSEKLHVMGRALIDVATKIGDMGHTNHAGMSHVSQFGTSTYAFLQNANGQTLVNAKSGQVILMRNNNATLMQIGASSTGNVSQRYMWRDGFVANSTSINTVVKVVGTLHATGVLVVTSDIRIKENVRELDDNECLSIVRKLNPCKYNYKDSIKKGINDVIGFISQEVEAVFPQATSRNNTEYIPSHYEKCEVADDIIKTTKPHEFIVGDKLKFYDSEDKELLHEVIKIIDEYTFKINETLEYTELFIYGKEVNDLCILDKASIFTLNVSATQQLDRIITRQQTIIDDLLKRIVALEG